MRKQSDGINDDWTRRYADLKLGTSSTWSRRRSGRRVSDPAAGGAPPPNILYIHSHDTGRYVQPYGYQVPTPNIQLLADQGVLFREAFCAMPTCSGSRACLLTGEGGAGNGMLGLAHRGWRLNDYRHHLVHTLRGAGYRSTLIGEQHISGDPAAIGYDEVIPIDSTHAHEIAPKAIEMLRTASEPFFVSVGFFETHRDFAAPTSVRDTLYSLPPPNLPDTTRTREDMAAFKASARSLDQGIGAVLNGLHSLRAHRAHADHLHHRPRARLPRREGDPLRPRDRGDDDHAWPRRVHRRQGGRRPGHPPGRLPDPLRSGRRRAPRVARGQVADAARARRAPTLHDAVFSEMTYHAAYQPQRAVRTTRWKYIRRFDDYPHPVLANCDDSATKEVLVEAGWGEQAVAPEELYDLVLDPERGLQSGRRPGSCGRARRAAVAA